MQHDAQSGPVAVFAALATLLAIAFAVSPEWIAPAPLVEGALTQVRVALLAIGGWSLVVAARAAAALRPEPQLVASSARGRSRAPRATRGDDA